MRTRPHPSSSTPPSLDRLARVAECLNVHQFVSIDDAKWKLAQRILAGLETEQEPRKIEAIIKDDAEALALYREEMKGEEGGDKRSDTTNNNVIGVTTIGRATPAPTASPACRRRSRKSR